MLCESFGGTQPESAFVDAADVIAERFGDNIVNKYSAI